MRRPGVERDAKRRPGVGTARRSGLRAGAGEPAHDQRIDNLITEGGDNLVTESGDLLITES